MSVETRPISGEIGNQLNSQQKPQRHLRLVPDLPKNSDQFINPVNTPPTSFIPTFSNEGRNKTLNTSYNRIPEFPSAVIIENPLSKDLKPETNADVIKNSGRLATEVFTSKIQENPKAERFSTEPAMTPYGTLGELYIDVDPDDRSYQSIKMQEIVPGQNGNPDTEEYYRLHLDSGILSKKTAYGIEVNVTDPDERHEIAGKIEAVALAEKINISASCECVPIFYDSK